MHLLNHPENFFFFRLIWPHEAFIILMCDFYCWILLHVLLKCNLSKFPIQIDMSCKTRKVASVLPSFLTSTGMFVMFKSSMSSCQRLESCPSSIGSSWIPGLLRRQEGLKSRYGSLNKTSLHPVNCWRRKERGIRLFGTAH